jgi:N-acetylneuraminic acid mutarotase
MRGLDQYLRRNHAPSESAEAGDFQTSMQPTPTLPSKKNRNQSVSRRAGRQIAGGVALAIFVAVTVAFSGIALGAPFGFSNTGSLADARTSHTATLLQDGKVLVTGGATVFPNQLSSAELYDPATSTWTATGSLAHARQGHTATLLPDGRVLVAGGYNSANAELASAEVYDPANGTWSPTGNLNGPRELHTATLLPNGKVLVAGGANAPITSGGHLKSAELYDPATGLWTATGSMSAARILHTMTLLADGKVLVAGGSNDKTSNTFLASAELYDPATGMWTATGSLSKAREFHTATRLLNGKVLVAGGRGTVVGPGGSSNIPISSAELFDPATGSWTATGSLLSTRESHKATLLPDGRVIIEGGGNSNYLPSAELYNPANGTWSTTGSIVRVRAGHTATLMPNSQLLIAGGISINAVILSSAELFAPVTELANLSSRIRIETGDNVLIGGFIVTGPDPKRIILRALGPSLPMADKLADPILELHDSSGAILETNDNWMESPNKQSIIESGTAPTRTQESAIMRVLSPAAYTAVVRGANNGTGIGVVELYDVDASATSALANISTRGFVQGGDNVLIAGVIVAGESSQKVIIRATGPSLAISGNLANPTLELRDGNGALLEENDDWVDSPNQQAIIDSTVQPANDLEAAIVRVLTPAGYTAIVRGAGGTTGIAVVEVYALHN